MKVKHVLLSAGLVSAILASACSPKQQPASDPGSEASGELVASAAEAPRPDIKLLEEARDRVRDITFASMLTQEKQIESAYSQGNADDLSTRSELLMQGAPDARNWKGNEFDPYLKCDTAWRDLGLYASALAKDLKYGGDTHRKILEQERADYNRTKRACQEYLGMSGEAAWKAEEARFSK